MTMDMLKKFSLSGLVERFGQSFRRFPIAMLLTMFLACFLIYLNHNGDVSDKMVLTAPERISERRLSRRANAFSWSAAVYLGVSRI